MEGSLGNHVLLLGKMSRKMMGQASSVLALHGDPGVFTESPEDILRTVGSFLLEKLHDLLHWLETLPGLIQEKLDQILPPETRSATLHHWLVVALTVVLPVVLSLLCLYYCCKCCCCSGRGRRVGSRLMKAPGRGGQLMPRSAFEGNPMAYFKDLRAGKDLY